jgi:hypothetical protein
VLREVAIPALPLPPRHISSMNCILGVDSLQLARPSGTSLSSDVEDCLCYWSFPPGAGHRSLSIFLYPLTPAHRSLPRSHSCSRLCRPPFSCMLISPKRGSTGGRVDEACLAVRGATITQLTNQTGPSYKLQQVLYCNLFA